jgi:UDPglucose--hexose-1-phosphate uridylyltransferase
MSILRFDATSHDWVIFAPSRARRPHELRRPTRVVDGAASRPCPFCPGNEELTPSEVYAVRNGSPRNGAGWQVRVVPNAFPALQIEADDHRASDGEVFQFMGGTGAHEVIVESPHHELPLWRQSVEQVEMVLLTLQARYNALKRDRRIQTIVVFKNHGEGAGTSLRHPHCQLIATPVVPRLLRVKHAIAQDYFDRTGDCLYTTLLEEELSVKRRVLCENAEYAAVMPYASHVPFETWILPKFAQSSFGDVAAHRFPALAEALRMVLLKLDAGLNNPDFNLTFNTVPRGDEGKDYFLWHISVLPRLSTPAGFELASGMSINTVLPEEAADFLREVEVE